MEYKTATKFTVCSHAELIKKGWEYDGLGFWHDDFSGNNVNEDMIGLEGKTLTISKYRNVLTGGLWYSVEENNWKCPSLRF